MKSIEDLHAGYRRFREGRYSEAEDRYRRLAEQGQSPAVMLIACCDSRADPAMIFDAGPGELFVLRNVANLVPPPEDDNAFHGTSAAIEFAVTVLGICHIVVMGHAQCGGVRAYVDGAFGHRGGNTYIDRWASLLAPAYDSLPEGLIPDEAAQQLERAAIRQSLIQLCRFPFVRERIQAGRLNLHGAFFGIASGVLEWLDEQDGTFRPIA
ncbi:MAG TPA: carbonic anhydrase [Alphaproteobacteria bacterium]|nr:carbonic anhydrase [Alphaproteobacteria bacterium]